MLLSSAEHTCSSGAMSSSATRALFSLSSPLVDPNPLLVLVICPFAVAVLWGRCLVMSLLFMLGRLVVRPDVCVKEAIWTKLVVIQVIGGDTWQFF